MKLDSIEAAIDDFRDGKFVIVVDDEDRENEGDLIIAAEKITPEKVNFMLKHARGVLCAPITISRCEELDLPHQVSDNTSVLGTPFTVTIDKLEGCTTGVSAADRAATIQALADPASKPETFGRPGHVNPLYAQEKGVLRRAGHTEACVDMARLAGLYPAAALMEIMNEDGSMARLPELLEFAERHHIKIGTIADLISYRNRHESIVERVAENDMQTQAGPFHAVVYRDKPSQSIHLALIKGTISPEQETLVRVHQPVSLIDLLETGSTRHAWHLPDAMRAIQASERGILVMLNCNELPGEFLAKFDTIGKQRAQDIPQAASQTLRNYGIGAQILRDIGAGKIKLLANPKKMPSMTGFNLDIVGYLDNKDL